MWLQLEEVTGATPDSIKTVQLLRTGDFKYGGYGAFQITPDTLRELKSNYDNNIRRVKIAVDYFHEAFAEAAGWIEGIELRAGDNELWITVDWTPEAVEKIMAKEIRYLSADMDFNYMDIESGQEYGCVLLGAGLTNRPYIKDMKAILSELAIKDRKKEILLNDKKKETTMPTFDDIMKCVNDLTDDQKAQLADKLGTVKASEVEANTQALKLAEAAANAKSSEIKQLSEKVGVLEKQLEETVKAGKFAKLLSDGKAVEAQRVAYMAGDMEAFVAGAVKVNLSEDGSAAVAEGIKNADVALKKLNEIAAEKEKSGSMTFSEGFKQAMKENPELAKAVA